VLIAMVSESELKGALPKVGEKFITHNVLEKETIGWFVENKYIKNRRTNEPCTYLAFVPGCGGDIWWCINSDKSTAVYSFTELEFAEDKV